MLYGIILSSYRLLLFVCVQMLRIHGAFAIACTLYICRLTLPFAPPYPPFCTRHTPAVPESAQSNESKLKHMSASLRTREMLLEGFDVLCVSRLPFVGHDGALVLFHELDELLYSA